MALFTSAAPQECPKYAALIRSWLENTLDTPLFGQNPIFYGDMVHKKALGFFSLCCAPGLAGTEKLLPSYQPLGRKVPAPLHASFQGKVLLSAADSGS